MKKLLICAAVSLTLLFTGVPAVASASTAPETECDEVFAATVSSLTDSEQTSLHATRKPLYDISVTPLGYVYEFTLEGADGYAVFLYRENKFIPQEVMPEAVSPYAEAEGKCVYVCSFTYLDYSDGEYIDLASGIKLLPESVEYMAEEAVYGDGGIMLLATSQISIEFATRDRYEYEMSLQPPHYTDAHNISSCACLAGANIIGFYDRYCENLIPNYEPGYMFMDMFYLYDIQTAPIYDLVDQLYIDMGTTDNGTTQSQFENGMRQYCNRAGYSITFTSLMSGGSLDYSKVITYTEQLNQPLALFLMGYNVAALSEGENKDMYGYYLSDVNHVMVGFGYRYVNYTYKNGSTETLNFIYVSAGITNSPIGYFNINYNTKINDILAVNIY